jgi:hypothetical protein
VDFPIKSCGNCGFIIGHDDIHLQKIRVMSAITFLIFFIFSSRHPIRKLWVKSATADPAGRQAFPARCDDIWAFENGISLDMEVS